MEGWIKLHRKMVNWEWFTDTNVLAVFMYLLLSVNFKETRFKGKVVPVGAMLTTADQIAQGTNLSVWQVRAAIDKLRSTGEIQVTRQFRKVQISVCKYASYQCRESNETNLLTNSEPIYLPIQNQFTTNLHKNKNNKEDKEEKNIEKDTTDVVSKKAFDFRAEVLQTEPNIDQSVVEDYIAYRKKNRWSLSKTVLSGLVKEAGGAGLTLEQAMRIYLEQSWRGFKAEWVRHLYETRQQPQQKESYQDIIGRQCREEREERERLQRMYQDYYNNNNQIEQ